MHGMVAAVCPLVFKPLFRPKIWGGRNLERLLEKPLPAGEIVGESWECADLEAGQSVVAAGPAAGRTLHELVDAWGADLLGRAPLVGGRFPLLIKFLDAVEPLSIQVHPDAETAARIGDGARPKEEMFYVIDAAPNGCIYLGLRPGVTRDDLAAAANSGRIESLLHRIPVKPGQSFHARPGTVHALGAGVVVAEVETPSDTTYRIYDWGRSRGPADSGLHLAQALESVRFEDIAPPPPRRSHVGGLFTTVTRLTECPAFVVEKVRFIEGMDMEIPYAELVVWVVLEGRGTIRHANGRIAFKKGDVVVLPAALRDGRLKTELDCTWLEVTIPTPSDLADLPHPSAENLREPQASVKPIQLNLGNLHGRTS